MPQSGSIHGKAFSCPTAISTASHSISIRLTGGHQAAFALVVVDRLDELEGHAGQLAVDMFEGLGHMEVDDRYAFVLGIFLLPGRGLHLVEAAAHDHLDIGAAQPA
jgi:hypothetical protein